MLRIHNSLEEEAAVLIEKINLIDTLRRNRVFNVINEEGGTTSRPSSRQEVTSQQDSPSIEEENKNNGILKMSPRS